MEKRYFNEEVDILCFNNACSGGKRCFNEEVDILCFHNHCFGGKRTFEEELHDSLAVFVARGFVFYAPNGLHMSSDSELKVVLVGEQSVGKTSIIQRVCTGGFNPECQATLGASFHSKSLMIDGEEVIFEMWDTAGQERYRSMATLYLRGAHIVMLVYSVGDRVSFAALNDWLHLISEKCDPNVVVFLVGNKVDIDESQREVSVTEGVDFANEKGMAFSEISALSGVGIDTLFAAMGKVFIEERNNNKVTREPEGQDLTKTRNSRKKCC